MKNLRPPKLAEKFLLLFLKEELEEEVLGDLDEKFYSTLKKKSLSRARLNYWYQVFNYLRPFSFKYFKSNLPILAMTRHNFLISYRVLTKNSVFSIINIGGLAMGMTVAILIGLWILDEFSFNKNHDHYDRIVQVLRKNEDRGVVDVNSSLVGQVGIAMKETYPTIFEHVTMTFFRTRQQMLTVGKQSFDESGYFFRPGVAEMLSLKMIRGGQNWLEDRRSVMLSATLAEKLFGKESPIGKMVTLNTWYELSVTGVYEDLPVNSEFGDAHFIASMDLIYDEENPYSWNNYNMKVYALLKPEIDLKEASAIIKDILVPHTNSDGNPVELFLLPMKDWHLNSTFEDGIQVRSSQLQFVILNGIIGVFVLLLACINFMNLNTARYQNRGKEVGIRKAIGSLRSQLVSQFLSESFLYAFASFFVSLAVVSIVLPWFNTMSGKALMIPWENIWFWGIGIMFTVGSALIAGSYPAIFLSSFGPTQALKGTLKQGVKSVRFRQALVVFQFTISIALIIGTITVNDQIQHAKNRPVGYNQEGLITVKGRSAEYYEKFHVLRDELIKTGMVTEIAEANYPLMTTLGNNDGFSYQDSGERIETTFNTIFVTHEYGKTTGWELIDGRDFSREHDEEGSIIISESAMNEMRLENPIGQKILARREFNGRKSFTIIGVVRDMIKGSPFQPPKPLMVFNTEDSRSYLFIRLKEGVRYDESLSKVQDTFERILPTNPFNYEFVDAEYQRKFRSEERIGSLASLFSGLAIIISCLGLFGLSAFMVEQRTKEIGMRKVLGASVSNLWNLLSRNFTVLILIASLVAIPIASYLLNSWLEGYEYRIQIRWSIYLVAGVVCLTIALLTVSFHALKASFSDPVKSLRSE